MKDALPSQDHNAARLAGFNVDDVSHINPCCLRIFESLAHINTMMVCSDCKQILKTFREEKAYRNYLKFCQGRSRVVNTGFYKDQWIVVYHSYDA